MSLQSVIARINEIQGALAPLSPPAPRVSAPPSPPAGGQASFSTQLQTAMGGSPASPSTLDPAAPAGATGAAPAGAVGKQAAPGTYPRLTGDLDCKPELLKRLDALAAKKGMKFHITSGHRSIAEQQRLWDNRHNNPYPVARPGSSRHHAGDAADVTIGGRAIQDVIPASELRAAGLHPLIGDAVHVELPR